MTVKGKGSLNGLPHPQPWVLSQKAVIGDYWRLLSSVSCHDLQPFGRTMSHAGFSVLLESGCLRSLNEEPEPDLGRCFVVGGRDTGFSEVLPDR